MIAFEIAPATAPLATMTFWRSWLIRSGSAAPRDCRCAVHPEGGEDVADPVDDDDGAGKGARLRLGDALGDDLLDLGHSERDLRRIGEQSGGAGRGVGPGDGPADEVPPPPPHEARIRAVLATKETPRFISAF